MLDQQLYLPVGLLVLSKHCLRPVMPLWIETSVISPMLSLAANGMSVRTLYSRMISIQLLSKEGYSIQSIRFSPLVDSIFFCSIHPLSI